MPRRATKKTSLSIRFFVDQCIKINILKLPLLALAFFLLCQSLPTHSFEKSPSTFTIAMPFLFNAPPYLWRNHHGEMVGTTIDAYELIAQQQGYQLNWQFYSPAQANTKLLQDYQADKIDIFLSSIPKVIPRQALQKIDTHLISVSIHAFTPSHSTLAELSIKSLPNYQGIVGPIVNFSLADIENKHIVLTKLQPLLVTDNDSQAITEALEKNKADFSIGERSILAIRFREQELDQQYQIMEPALGTIPTIMHYRVGSGFEDYLQGFKQWSTLLNNNGRVLHIKEKNMRRYLSEAHHSRNL